MKGHAYNFTIISELMFDIIITLHDAGPTTIKTLSLSIGFELFCGPHTPEEDWA